MNRTTTKAAWDSTTIRMRTIGKGRDAKLSRVGGIYTVEVLTVGETIEVQSYAEFQTRTEADRHFMQVK